MHKSPSTCTNNQEPRNQHDKGVVNPFTVTRKVRSNKDSKVNIFGILLYRLESKDCKIVNEVR